MSNLKNNTLSITIEIDQDTDVLDIQLEHSLSDSLEDGQMAFYLDMLNGIGYKINAEAESMAFQGSLIRKLSELREEIEELTGDEILFEPDEELLEKLKEAKDDNVISIKDKLH